MAKPTVLFISDLWGWEAASSWQMEYKQALSSYFSIEFLDVRELANVPKSCKEEYDIHRSLVNGGIEIATQQLYKTIEASSIVVGFSVGGTIAWKAALRGMPFEKMLLLSSTRLRKETNRPNSYHKIELYFGATDPNIPDPKWKGEIQFPEHQFHLLPEQGHQFYRQSSSISYFSEILLSWCRG